MVSKIITNKWILVGFGFVVMCIAPCYLWFQQETAPYREQAKELDERIHQSKQQQAETTATSSEQAVDVPMDRETSVAQKATTDTTIERSDDINTGQQT